MRKSIVLAILGLALTACATKKFDPAALTVMAPITPVAAPTATTTTTGDATTAVAVAPAEPAVAELLREHNDLVALINAPGAALSARSDEELNLYAARLTRLETLETELTKRDDRYVEEMRTKGHQTRIATNRQALSREQAARAARR